MAGLSETPKKETYPKQTVAERNCYRVTVKWHGVFTEWKSMVAQAGDCRGEVILEAEGHKYISGPILCFIYSRESNLE